MRYRELLTELKIINKELLSSNEQIYVMFNTSNGETLLLDRESFDDFPSDTLESFFGEYYDDDMNFYDIIEIPNDEDTVYQLFNIVDNKLLIMPNDEMGIDSVLNKNVQKIVKELDLDGIEYYNEIFDNEDNEEEISQYYSREDVIGANVKNAKFYHGTDYASFLQIIKKGIMGNARTNYEKINHESRVFFTTKLSKAAYHSINSAIKNDSIPVILELKVPDLSRLVLDYDIAIDKYGIDHPLTVQLGYDMIYHEATKNNMFSLRNVDTDTRDEWKKISDRNSLNTKTGIFGYSGRIPSTHITGIFIDTSAAAMYEVFGSEVTELSGKSHVDMVRESLDNKYTNIKDVISDIRDVESELHDEMDDEDED